MSVQFNFFSWIREGVKQSVMLGVADAIEDLGTPPDKEESTQQVLRFLNSSQDAKAITAEGTGRRGGAKRLGRSLKDVATE